MPPLHGGGQGFESPRLHSRNIRANSPHVGEVFLLNPLHVVEPLITMVVLGWVSAPMPREGQPRREASAQSTGPLRRGSRATERKRCSPEEEHNRPPARIVPLTGHLIPCASGCSAAFASRW